VINLYKKEKMHMQINADKNDTEVTKHKGNRYIKFTKQLINYLLFPILILVIWELISRLQVVPSILLPSIEDVVKSFILQIKSGQLINDLAQSLIRVFKGYFIAVILGISTGIIMGISEKTNKFFTIVFNGIRQIPPLAWIPLFILWFGIGETSKVIMIAMGAFFSILLNTINGIKNTPKQYLEVAKLYKIKR
jgi:ABC-type nitrate/sulfonate/bicarbonate transport system, permease component